MSYFTTSSPNFITSWKLWLPVGENAECSLSFSLLRWRRPSLRESSLQAGSWAMTG